jgi:hypothetical protein
MRRGVGLDLVNLDPMEGEDNVTLICRITYVMYGDVVYAHIRYAWF